MITNLLELIRESSARGLDLDAEGDIDYEEDIDTYYYNGPVGRNERWELCLVFSGSAPTIGSIPVDLL